MPSQCGHSAVVRERAYYSVPLPRGVVCEGCTVRLMKLVLRAKCGEGAKAPLRDGQGMNIGAVVAGIMQYES